MDLEAIAAHNRARTQAKNRRTFRQGLRLALLRLYASLASTPQSDLSDLGQLPPNARILVIRPDHLGDVLFTTPALRALRRSRPQAHITALVGPWAARVLQGNPNVDEVLTCPFPGFTRQPKGNVFAPYRSLNDYAKKLRRLRFDAALILRPDHWWGALLAYRAAIPLRLGTAYPETAPFLTLALPPTPDRHEVAHNLDLVAPLAGGSYPKHDLGLAFYLNDTDRAYAQRLLGHASGYWIAIHPGAGAPVKRWRPEAWAQVGDALARETGAQIVLTGSSSEIALCQAIAASMHTSPVVLAGQTSLGELAAVYAHCRLVLGPDSGPLHLAVALGVPTIHLYGPADPVRFGPWGDPARHRVVTLGLGCSPCHHLDWLETELAEHPCVWAIPVERVLEEARDVLGTHGNLRS